jgi:hypothetical protein
VLIVIVDGGHGGAYAMQCVRLARGQVATVAPDVIGDDEDGVRQALPRANGDGG